MWAWSIIYCDEQVTRSDYKWGFSQERVNSDTADTKTDVVFVFFLYSHVYSTTQWMISPSISISFPQRDPQNVVGLQIFSICYNCLCWADEDINQIGKYETAFFSSGQQHSMADGSLDASMYPHLFLPIYFCTIFLVSFQIPYSICPTRQKVMWLNKVK